MLVVICANAPLGSSAITLSTRPAPRSWEPVICSHCKKKHHTKPYCIALGGGMAGKTIEESRVVHQLDKSGMSATNTNPPLVGTSAAPANEFAGIIQTTDNLEWDGFSHMAMLKSVEEEVYGTSATPEPNIPASLINVTTSINWDEASKPVNFTKITVATLNQSSQTLLSLTKFPFYVDSGASIYVMPDESDFYTLNKIEPLLHSVIHYSGPAPLELSPVVRTPYSAFPHIPNYSSYIQLRDLSVSFQLLHLYSKPITTSLPLPPFLCHHVPTISQHTSHGLFTPRMQDLLGAEHSTLYLYFIFRLQFLLLFK
ncbi:hypothetical protein BYT27DRAFT_7096510 [Phlegmacium glaucopus]|nr:hypothetical protein BYT27DRAFT_7096510 [Phlegmacium glaucopus]